MAAQAEGLNKLRASTPTLAIWDDHDYGANDAGAEFSGRLKAEELFHRFWHTPAGSVLRRREGLYYHENLAPRVSRSRLSFSTRGASELASFQRTPLMRRGKSATSQMMRRIRTCSARPNGHGFWSAFREPAPCVLWFLLFRCLRRATAGRLGACFPGSVPAFLSCLRERRARGDSFGRSPSRRPLSIPSGPGSSPGGADFELPEFCDPWNPGGARPLRVGPTFRDENFGSLSFDWAQRQFELALFDRDGLILTSYHGALFDSGGRAMDLGFGGKRAVVTGGTGALGTAVVGRLLEVGAEVLDSRL